MKEMRKVTNFLKNVGRAIKQVLSDRRGYNDMVLMASAIISTVVVAIIGVYISSQIWSTASLDSSSPFNTAMNAAINIMNTTFPLIVVVAIAIIAGVIMSYLLGGFGITGGEKGKKGE